MGCRPGLCPLDIVLIPQPSSQKIGIQSQTTPFRVLMVVTLSEEGGAQKYVYALAKALPRTQFEVRVVCGPGGPLIERLRDTGVQVHILDPFVREVRLENDWSAFGQLRKIIREWRPDIVHLNSSKAGFSGRMAARMEKVPVIVYSAHGFVLSEPLPFAKKVAFWLAEKAGAIAGHRTVAVSEADRQLALRYRLSNKDSVVTIHNGIESIPVSECDTCDGLLRKELGVGPGVRLVGAVANFYPTKGLAYFIDACQLIRERAPDTRFILIGDGKERQKLEHMARVHGLSGVFYFLGRRADAWRLLRDFNVFVLSSVKEGMPFVLLEAMMQSRPIVAARVGGVPEAIENRVSGLLVNPKSARELAEAVIELLENPANARQLGVAARERVLRHFRVDRMADQTMALYDQLLTEECATRRR